MSRDRQAALSPHLADRLKLKELASNKFAITCTVIAPLVTWLADLVTARSGTGSVLDVARACCAFFTWYVQPLL